MSNSADDRLGIPPEQQASRARLSLNSADGRNDRAADRREAEDEQLTEDDRFDRFRQSQISSVLPNLPAIPGYRTCWLTTKTSNAQDSIHVRQQWGYVPVAPHEAPELASLVQNGSGEFAGLISMNEMVAYKISERMYQRIMRELHHDRPRQEEEAIKQAAEAMMEQAKAAKSPAREIGDGTAELLKGGDRPFVVSD